MNAEQEENLKAWAKALRSDQYKQAAGALCFDDGYCCLGVGGKVIGLTDDELRGVVDDEGCEPFYYRIRAAFGLQDCLGRYEGGQLTNHNDSERLTFSQIADIIESRPKGLFVE